jgi:hypothetical protein
VAGHGFSAEVEYVLIVASLQTQVVSDRRYDRIVESRRVEAKPRPLPVLYLGTADTILRKLTEHPEQAVRVRTYQHGDVASLKAAADSLRVLEIIDEEVCKGNPSRANQVHRGWRWRRLRGLGDREPPPRSG